jgi:acylphosphatase
VAQRETRESGGQGPGDLAAVTVTVTGRVQGVGFRSFTHDHARRLGLTGYVMNLRGGGVRAYAEGPREVLEQFLEILRRGPSGSHVQDVWASWGVGTGAHDWFTIEPTR